MTVAAQRRGTDPATQDLPWRHRRFLRLVERHALVARRYWWTQLAMFAEPFLYLGAIGIGVGALVGDVTVDGRTLDYDEYLAPALLMASAMNGAVIDCTVSFFVRLKYGKVYDAVLSTPLGVGDLAAGDLAWTVLRAVAGGVTFLVAVVALGLMDHPLGLASILVVALVALAFGAVGLAAATFMRGYVDFDPALAAALALFLFSAVFFPIDQYPGPVQAVVEWTPLYRAVELSRDLFAGSVGLGAVATVAELTVLALAGWWVARRRMAGLLTS